MGRRLRQLVDEVREAHASSRAGPFDPRVPAALITCALSITLLYYYGEAGRFAQLFPSLAKGAADTAADPWIELRSRLWWLGSRILLYVIVPACVARASGIELRELGLTFRGFRRHVWIYATLYGLVLPAVVAVSYTDRFLRRYPLYKDAGLDGAHLAAWFAIYAASFFTIEFFYRGFLVAMLRRSMGLHAVFVMVVPYVFIHQHKPIAETLGAVVTGTIFGALALGTGSIWFGYLTHVSVAFTMDLLAIAHHQRLF